MKKVFQVLAFFSLLISGSTSAQDVVKLSLQDALENTLSNNKSISIARLEEESARAKFHQMNAIWLPHISLSYTALTTSNPLNAFGFKLQQESIAASDFNPTLLNNPSATQNFMTKAEWQQPILNLDRMNMRKAAYEETNVYGYKVTRTQEYQTFEVRKAYAQLQLAHQAVKVLEEALNTVNAIYASTHNRFENGLLQKSDELLVQVQVTTTERQLAEAKSSVRDASDNIGILMNRPLGTVYDVENEMVLSSIVVNEESVPDNRADFSALRSAISARDKMIGATKMSYLPKVNAFAEYMINDREAFGFGANSYLVGAQLSWIVFNGTETRFKATEQRAERNKLVQQLQHEKEKSKAELLKTSRQWDDARIGLQQQEIAVRQADEALRIVQNRYYQGLVTTNDVLQAQTILSQQKLSRAQTIFHLNTIQAYMQFLTSSPEK